MPVEKLGIPVQVAHDEQEGYRLCAASGLPLLMEKLGKNTKAALITIRGGQNTGDPCEPGPTTALTGLSLRWLGRLVLGWLLRRLELIPR